MTEQTAVYTPKSAYHSMQVVGYTYEADIHCQWCAAAHFGIPTDGYEGELDERMADQRDREGNTPSPIFGDAEFGYVPVCADCGCRL